MPIYMDRHDVSDAVTAEHVAELHQQDLKVQDQFGCRGLTYWFDEKRKTAFCLIEAPDKKTLQDMHDKAHGEIPHRIIEVDPHIVESFLGRIEDPEKSRDTLLNIINDPAFRTIMVMRLYEDTAQQIVENRFQPQSHKFIESIPGIVDSYGGKIVKQGGNHYLISFTNVSNAVHAAIDLHALYRHLTIKKNNIDHTIKFGLSAGLPVTGKDLIFEDSIRSAERLCKFIDGDIIISAEVKELYNSENVKPITEDKKIITLSRADERFLHLLMDHTEKIWNDVHLKTDDFCKPVGISKSQLYRKLLFLTGKAPNAFIREYRLSAAIQLLTNRTGNISEIAFETGFSSPSYFTKCFQKRFGYNPSHLLHPPA